MDRSQYFQFLPIIIMFTWMMITPFLFPYNWVIRYAMNMVGMVISICFLVVTNEVLKWKASEFTHIDATCRPSNNRMHIYVKEIETVEIEPGIFATNLTLGEGTNSKFYGAIEKEGNIVFKHWGQWEDRMHFSQGKALFKGQVVDHAKSAKVILYEPEGTFDMDHLNPIPVYLLKDAPGDFLLPEDQPMLETAKAGEYLTKKIVSEGKEMTGATLLFGYQKIKKENENFVTRNIELQRQALHWHQVAVRLEEVNKQIKNELHSVLSSKSDQKQAVVEQVLTALEAHTKIRSALKSLMPTPWLNKAFAFLILGILGIGVFLTNPGNILDWLATKSNQLFVIILSAVLVFVYVYAKQKK